MVTCSISLLLGGESRTCQLMNALASCLSSDSVCCLSFNLYSFYKALAFKSLYYCWSRLLFTKTQRALPSKSNTRTQQIRYPISPDEAFQLYFLTHKTRQSMMSILVSRAKFVHKSAKLPNFLHICLATIVQGSSLFQRL